MIPRRDIIVGLVRIGFIHLNDTGDMTYSGYWITMWSILEPLIAVVVANCMTFRPLLHLWARSLKGLYTHSSRNKDQRMKDSFVRLEDEAAVELSNYSATTCAGDTGKDVAT